MTNLTDVPSIDSLAEQLAGVRSIKALYSGGTATTFDVYCKDQLGVDIAMEDVPLSIAGMGATFLSFLNGIETNLVAALATLGVT